MNYIKLMVVLIMFWCCNESRTNSQNSLENVSFADTVFSAGLYFKYVIIDETCYLKVGDKKHDKTVAYYEGLEQINKMEGCAIYSPRWINNKVLVASNGCGNYFTNNDIFVFHSDSIERQRYGHIEGFDNKKVIAYLEDNLDDFLVIKDVFSNKKDTLFLKQMPVNEDLRELEEYTFSIEALKQDSNNNYESLDFVNDTVFFNFLKQDTFYVFNLK